MNKSITGANGLIAKVRKALDDIAPSVTDTFATDTDNEITQALEHAAESLLMSVPVERLTPAVITETTTTPSWSRNVRLSDNSGYIVVPSDYLRFISLKMTDWQGTVNELMEPGSEAEKHQRSKWSRGSNTKPKAMCDTLSEGTIIRYWPGSASNTLESLQYVGHVSMANNTLVCALNDECEKNLIYMACRIFLEGKKEAATAEKFAQLMTE